MRGLEASEYPKEFRPDVQALRAIAVVLVVMYHANIPAIHGGFFGVDVFFVVSGFVITNVLLEERAARGTASISGFYARRVRRILPAATVVLILTIFFTYHYLAFVTGASVAGDAKWVAAFLGNFHFATVGTNYFLASNPPSTLQQFWSLGVEEQFYVCWPILFVGLTYVGWHRLVSWHELQGPNGAVTKRPGRGVPPWLWTASRAPMFFLRSPRRRLVTFLTMSIAASLTWCIVETNQDSVWAFFSPFTRAWELALGCLIAVAGPVLRARLPRSGLALQILGTLTLIGCTWYITSTTLWPGSAVIVPVAATAVIIVGGSLRGVERMGWFAKLPPIQFFGNISYSLYLVHWPILEIAIQYVFPNSAPLGVPSRVGLCLLSVAVAKVLYDEIENPIRRSKFLVKRRLVTFAMGALLIGASYGAIYWHLDNFGQALPAPHVPVLTTLGGPSHLDGAVVVSAP